MENKSIDYDAMGDTEFRAALRTWLEDVYPENWKQTPRRPLLRIRGKDARAWIKMLCEGGWRCPAWPKEYGGMELSFKKQIIYHEELERIRAGRIIDGGEQMIGPTLMAYGTDEQKRKYIEPTRTGEYLWAQGYSEPGAGSDLASLRTKAELEGDHYRINGHKIWTSHADECSHMYALVRTTVSEKKQVGITFILIDMETPGISVRPIKTVAGEDELCEVFLDDVMVPKENVVGEPDNGWTIAKALLGYERVWIGNPGPAARYLDLACELIMKDETDSSLKDELAKTICDMHDFRVLYETMCHSISPDSEIGPEFSILKIISADMLRDISELNARASGQYSQLDSDVEIDGALTNIGWQFFTARAQAIFAGSNEIQRNIVAKRVLNL